MYYSVVNTFDLSTLLSCFYTFCFYVTYFYLYTSVTNKDGIAQTKYDMNT